MIIKRNPKTENLNHILTYIFDQIFFSKLVDPFRIQVGRRIMFDSEIMLEEIV